MTGASHDVRSGSTCPGRGVVGILTRGPAYLMIRRAAGIAKGGYWCFPGGHVERGETPRQAIQRELAEELGIEVTPIERIGSVRVIGANRYVLAVWRVRHVNGTLRIAESEIAEARWLTPSQVRAIRPSLPSNDRVLQMLGV
ncbi:MAG: NUDIX domain-containing protein [Phycisphaerae bacterium]